MTTNTSDKGQHSELPWHADGPDMFGDYTIQPAGEVLAVAAVVSNMRPPEEVAANAELLIRSVNSHHELIEALTEAREFLAVELAELLACSCVAEPDGKPDRSTLDDMDRPEVERVEAVLARIDAALKAARGMS